MNWLVVDKIIKAALEEDNFYGDVTTESIISEESQCKVELIAKETGILAGLEIFKRVYYILGDVYVDFNFKDGDRVNKWNIIGRVQGNTRNILIGERVALNLLQRMSGIATLTHKMVKEIEGTGAKLLDTRKTTPNLRILERYAVKLGGGYNHRFNLSDGILIKDNHIKAAGGIKNAVALVRENTSFVKKIEVEVENLEELQEALDAKSDIIMLDNMDIDTMKKAVKIAKNRAILEASGNVTVERVKDIAKTGVDFISCGALTHSVVALDISMKNLKLI